MTAFVEYKFEFLLLINVREKETLAQVFSCEFCEICKNIFSCGCVFMFNDKEKKCNYSLIVFEYTEGTTANFFGCFDVYLLTHFSPMFHFCTPRKRQNVKSFQRIEKFEHI